MKENVKKLADAKTTKKQSSRSIVGPLVVGAAIGAGVALLTAPRSGKETRKMLGTKAKKLQSKAQQQARQLKGKAQRSLVSAERYMKKRRSDLTAAVRTTRKLGKRLTARK